MPEDAGDGHRTIEEELRITCVIMGGFNPPVHEDKFPHGKKLKRLIYKSFRRYYVIRSWIVSHFTRTGYLVLGGLTASAIIGLDTNRTMAYQTFVFLFILMLISILGSRFFRCRLTVERVLPKFSTVGESVRYRLRIQNHAVKEEVGLYWVENTESPLPDFASFVSVSEPGAHMRNRFDRYFGYYSWTWLISRKQGAIFKEQLLPALRPNSTTDIIGEMTPSRRGYIRLEGVTIGCPDPLGIFKSLVNIPLHQSLIVLPKRYTLPPVSLPGSRQYQSGGVALASSVGESEEFVSLRDYRPGDPLRRIHWKSWAKIGRPIVKEYQDEFFVRHALILDTFQSAETSEVLEEAVSVAASFACEIQSQESLLDLMFVGTEAFCFTSGRGLAHTDKLLEILACVRPCRERKFRDLANLVLDRSKTLSSCVCILISWDDDRKRLISRLLAAGLPSMVIVISETPASPDDDLEPMKDCMHRFHWLQTGKIQEGLRGL